MVQFRRSVPDTSWKLVRIYITVIGSVAVSQQTKLN